MRSIQKAIFFSFIFKLRTLQLKKITGIIETCYQFQHNLDGIFDLSAIEKQYNLQPHNFETWSVYPEENESFHEVALCKNVDNIIKLSYLYKEDLLNDMIKNQYVPQFKFDIDNNNRIVYNLPPFSPDNVIIDSCLSSFSIESFNTESTLDRVVKYMIDCISKENINVYERRFKQLYKNILKDPYGFMSKYYLVIFKRNLERFRIFFKKLLEFIIQNKNPYEQIKSLCEKEIYNEENLSWDFHFHEKNITDINVQKNFLYLGLIMDLSNIIFLSKDINHKWEVYSFLKSIDQLIPHHMFCISLDLSCIHDVENFSFEFVDEKEQVHCPAINRLNRVNYNYKFGFRKYDLYKKDVRSIKCVGYASGIKYESDSFKIEY